MTAVAVVLAALLTPSAASAAALPWSTVDPRTLPGVLATSTRPPSPGHGITRYPIVATSKPSTLPLAASDLRQALVQGGSIVPLAAATSQVIEDSATGTGTGTVSYSGGWTLCGGCAPSTPNNSFRYSLTAGATATVRFSGTQIQLYGVTEHAGGLATVRVDNGPTATIDTYAPTAANTLVYDSGPLADGAHTAVLTNLGQRNAASAAFAVSFDRAVILTDPSADPGGTGDGGGTQPASGSHATIEDTSIGTAANQVAYNGDWTECGGCVPSTPNNSFRYSLTAGATATIRWTGTRIVIYGVKEKAGGQLTVSVDAGPATRVDTFAPTSSNAVVYDSGPLTFGDHTAVVTNIGQRNAASAAFAVSFDRAETYTSDSTDTPPTTPPPPVVSGNRSGQPWLSGANGDPYMTPADVDGFCSFRGSPCDLAQVYVARDSWSSIVKPSFAQTNFAGWPGMLVLTVPPFPEDGRSTLAQCAAGAYSGYWKEFGRTLNTTGRQNSIIRLAWEANGDWYPWSGTDPAAYRGCYQRIVTDIRSTVTAPGPKFDWAINAHYSQNPPSHNPLELYPGDGYVDIVSIDAYDHYPAVHTQAEFDDQAAQTGGITWLYNFARAHGKLFGVGEWGVASGSDSGGGDNADYVQFMRDWMVARAGKGMYYEAYFNNCEMYNVGSNLYRPLGEHCLFQNTASAQRYAQLW